MLKIILFVAVLFAFILLVNFLVNFWIERRRKWRVEDEAFNAKKLEQAKKELRESMDIFDEVKEFKLKGEEVYEKRR